MATIHISDYAGAVDSVYVSEILVKSTEFTVASLTSLTSSIASSVSVGQPTQGDMRQLALARWNYMYPS